MAGLVLGRDFHLETDIHSAFSGIEGRNGEFLGRRLVGAIAIQIGGIVGKDTKVTDGQPEVEVEIANGVKVTAIRSLIADVRVKGEPVAANQK